MDRDNDQTARLTGRGPHGPSDRLSDVDHGPLRVDECDRIDAWYVDALGQDPGVGEQPPVGSHQPSEPVEGGFACPSGHRTRRGFGGDNFVGVHQLGEAGMVLSERVRLSDAGVERDGAASVPIMGGAGDRKMRGEGGGVILHATQLGEDPLVHEPGGLRVGDDRDDNLKVAQQPGVDGRGERQVMCLGAETLVVVHRHDLDPLTVGLGLGGGGVDPRGGRQEHPPLRRERAGGEAGEQASARYTVRLVHHQQV